MTVQHRSSRAGTLRATLAGTVVALATLTLATSALAAPSASPTQLTAETDATLSITTDSSGPLELVTRVDATIPGGFGYLGCGGPSGWGCTSDGTTVTWTRQTELDPSDPTLTLAVRVPAEPGQYALELSEERSTGATAGATVPLAVVAAEPTDEPTEEPTEPTDPESEEPSEEPTAAGQPAPPLEPLRPDDGQDLPPISLDDLAAQEPDDGQGEVATSSSGRSLTATAALPVVGLLLLSGLSFGAAYALREPARDTGGDPEGSAEQA